MPNRAPSRTGPPNAVDDGYEDLPELVDPSDDEEDLCDDDLEHLSCEERMQLAVTAVRASVMSERKAAIYYRVVRSTLIFSCKQHT
jgi:hypothetical protein